MWSISCTCMINNILFVTSDNNPGLGLSTPFRQLHWSYLCFLNLWLLLSPSQLCAEYAMDTIPPISSLTDPRNLLTLTTFAALISMLCYGMSGREGQRRKVLFALCLMVIPFIPASNLFFPVGFVIAERVLYIPSMGFCMLVGYGAWQMTTNKVAKKATVVGLIFLLSSHSVKTYHRNWDWDNNSILFTSALRVSTHSAKMWDFVGTNYHKRGNITLAEAAFRRSMEVEPLYTPAYVNLIRLLKREQRYEEAIEVNKLHELYSYN